MHRKERRQDARQVAEYGNWVSLRFVVVPGIVGLLLAVWAVFLPYVGIPAGVFALVSLYFLYARHQFSPRGRDVQARVLDQVLTRLPSGSEVRQVLDIGCGSGALSIAIVKRYPAAQVIGIDPWGAGWEYSKRLCEKNASVEGVADRVSFVRGDAASLPFESGTFDLVVSNLVFHEVRSAGDKKKVIQEALRVVKRGKWFVFQDLFRWRAVYGRPDALLGAIRSWGIDHVELVDTTDPARIPRALKLPFMLGTVSVLYGRKKT